MPSFGKKNGDKPTCCAACKPSTYIDVKNKRCLTEGCDTFTTKSNLYCANCDPEPGRRRKVKERRVFEALCAAGLKPTSWDKTMAEKACGKSRPDFFYEFDDRAIMVECDEFAHSPSETNYTGSCELRRMVDLHAASGGLPTIFVRFNPDPFELDGRTMKRDDRTRHAKLVSEVRRAMAVPAPPPGTLHVWYMFFGEVTCEGVATTDRGEIRRYSIDVCDPKFTATKM